VRRAALDVRDRPPGIVAEGQSLRRLLARQFFLLTLAAREADDVGRETFVAIHLEPERKPRAGSCGVLKADKAARLVGTTEFGSSMRRNVVGSSHDAKTRQRLGIGLDSCEVQGWEPEQRKSDLAEGEIVKRN
jgi:hypothetical protein